MKTLSRLTIPVVFITILFINGCTGIPIKIGHIDQQFSTIKVDFTRGRSIEASANGFQLLLFIPISINDRQMRAYSLLRDQAGDDYITDIKVQESWTYALVGTVHKTTIKAKAYPRK
jgi:hypothetical protein